MKNKSGTWWITIGAILQVISIVIIEILYYISQFGYPIFDLRQFVIWSPYLLLILLNILPKYNKTPIVKIFSVVITIIILIHSWYIIISCYLEFNDIEAFAFEYPYYILELLICFFSTAFLIKGNYISLKNFNEKKLNNTNEIKNHKSKETNIPLSCPHCKSPNTNKTLECEWCGNPMI